MFARYAAIAVVLGAPCALGACATSAGTPDGGAAPAPEAEGGGGGTDAGVVSRAEAGGPDASSVGEGDSSADAGDPACGVAPGTLGSASVSVTFADSIMARWPDPRNVSGTTHGWDYTVGVVLQGMARVYQRTGDARYLAYIQQYVDDFVDDGGTNSGLPAIPPSSNYDLDDFEPGNLLLFLYQKTGTSGYAVAAQSLLALFDDYPRNAGGGFWHKGTYPDQMWLDGIYMAEPFIAGYGALFPSCGSFCDTTPGQQIGLIAQHTQDSTSGLLYHAWDQSLAASWADPTTGRSPVIWSRGLGWFAMALVDVLQVTPSSSPTHSQLSQSCNPWRPVSRQARMLGPASGIRWSPTDAAATTSRRRGAECSSTPSRPGSTDATSTPAIGPWPRAPGRVCRPRSPAMRWAPSSPTPSRR